MLKLCVGRLKSIPLPFSSIKLSSTCLASKVMLFLSDLVYLLVCQGFVMSFIFL